MQPPTRRLLMTAIVLCTLVLVGGVARERLGIQLDVESVRVFAASLGPAGPFLFVFVVAGRSLLWLPSQVVLIAAGLCFGTAVGSLVGGAGLMLSGLLLFGLARYAGRASIERRMGRRIRHLSNLADQRGGTVAFGLACGYPVSPLSPLQAAAGLTAMSLANFVGSAFVGGALRASLFAYFGDGLIEASFVSLAWPTVVFLMVAGLPLLLPAGRRWLRELFVPSPAAKPEAEPPTRL